MARSYATDMWDGYKDVYERYEEGKNILNDMIKYLTERAQAEEQYSKALIKLGTRSQGDLGDTGTYGDSWTSVRAQAEGLGKHHGQVASQISDVIAAPLREIVKKQERQRDTLAAEASKLAREYDKLKTETMKAKSKYHKAAKDAESGRTALERTASGAGGSGDKPSKPRQSQTTLDREAQTAEQQYRQQVTEFQEFQKKFVESNKRILSEFQAMDSERVAVVRSSIEKLALMNEQMVSSLQQSNQILSKLSSAIDKDAEVQKWLEAKHTGAVPEPLVEYEPYISNAPHVGPNAAGPRASTSTPPASANTPPAMSTVRARALYDYRAADDTELSFMANDIITVRRVEDSGWWDGELHGRAGMFPANYVQLLDPYSAEANGSAEGASPRTCVALYTFQASSVDELSITAGEVLSIVLETEGWYMGTNARGESGLFPANYVQLR